MAQLIVRKLDSEIVARLKERAGKHGHSAEEEHRLILRQVLMGTEKEEQQMTFEQYLRSMPDIGQDEDFARIEGSMRDIDLSE
jgi:plasmid stability protein